MHANLGLSVDHGAEDEELGYPGWHYLKFLQALATWYIAGQQNGKELFFDLKYKYNLKPDLADRVSKM